jgi:FMN phosphatase YigB (HAD superfamily)
VSLPEGFGPIEVVTFDFWNTLVTEDPSLFGRRREGWAKVLADAGRVVTDAAIADAMQGAWESYVAAWMANVPFAAADGVAAALHRLDLGDLPRPVVDELIDVYRNPPADRHPLLTPNVAGCLATLHEAGVRVGIICDVGLTPSTVLRRYLDQQDVLRYFAHGSFSDEVGVYKPDPRIFDHALGGLGSPAPATAALVGDLRRTDIAGARAHGMLSVRYTGVSDDPILDGAPDVEGDLVVADHAELPGLLGVG